MSVFLHELSHYFECILILLLFVISYSQIHYAWTLDSVRLKHGKAKEINFALLHQFVVLLESCRQRHFVVEILKNGSLRHWRRVQESQMTYTEDFIEARSRRIRDQQYTWGVVTANPILKATSRWGDICLSPDTPWNSAYYHVWIELINLYAWTDSIGQKRITSRYAYLVILNHRGCLPQSRYVLWLRVRRRLFRRRALALERPGAEFKGVSCPLISAAGSYDQHGGQKQSSI